MQGQQSYQPQLFTVFDMEALIPKRHLLRQIDSVIDFGFVREATAELYCQENGRPSIDPELFVRIFAEAKDNHGLERARYRGRSKMQIQAYLIASVQNLKRLAGYLPAIAAALQQSADAAVDVFSSIFWRRNSALSFKFYFF